MVRWFVGGAELVCSGDARAGGESGSLWLFGEGGRVGEGGDWSIGGRMMGMGWVGRAGREGGGSSGDIYFGRAHGGRREESLYEAWLIGFIGKLFIGIWTSVSWADSTDDKGLVCF